MQNSAPKNPRTALMVSAANPKHLAKLPDLKADIALINLEDGVSPQQKPQALRDACEAIAKYRDLGPMKVVRINPLKESGAEEIAALNAVRPHAVRLPKVRHVSQVEKALELLDGGIDLHLSIETKEAFNSVASLKISDRVTTVYLGILDLLESLRLPQNLLAIDNPTIHYLLAKFLIDSKAAGFHPFSFVYQNHRDLEGFRRWCALEKSMGLEAKSCISPDQAAIAAEIFGNDAQIIEEARYVKERFEAMAAQGVTGFADDRLGFIDEPIYKNALLVLSKGA
ncbi:MAG: CoA ester lyase [Campylobacterales bacterium]